MISYAGSGYENGRPVSFYNIIYDDDAFDTFTIRHGVDGKDGKDGEDGISGTPGVDAVSYKFFMIYTSGEIDENGEAIAPAKPGANEGFYDFNFDEFFPPAGWYVNDDNLTPPIWMSTRTFASVKSYSDPEWSNPVKLTGDNGKDGEDGNKTEFIYKLTKTLDEKPETPHSDPTGRRLCT